MNNSLSQEIIKHILSNLLIISSDFINPLNYKSLLDNYFLLNEKLSFTLDNNKSIKNNIWGCQFNFLQEKVKILLGECSQDNEIIEYSVIISVPNSPTYGLYLVLDHIDSKPLIACAVDGKNWMTCNTFLQATFLAGMEQIKDIFPNSSKIDSYEDQYKLLLSLIRYHNSLYETYEDDNEGQEN